MGLDAPARSLDRAQSARLIQRRWEFHTSVSGRGGLKPDDERAQSLVNQGTTGEVCCWYSEYSG